MDLLTHSDTFGHAKNLDFIDSHSFNIFYNPHVQKHLPKYIIYELNVILKVIFCFQQFCLLILLNINRIDLLIFLLQ